ncbi:dolichol kinase [Balamuthia mandrillaris]
MSLTTSLHYLPRCFTFAEATILASAFTLFTSDAFIYTLSQNHAKSASAAPSSLIHRKPKRKEKGLGEHKEKQPGLFSLFSDSGWTIEWLLSDDRVFALCVYWASVLVVSLLLIAFLDARFRDAVPKIIVRKYYHLLTIVMFVPGIFYQMDFLRLAFGVALSALLLIEYVRKAHIRPFGSYIHQFMHSFIDSRDLGFFFLTHIHLLLGCAIPVWFFSSSLSYPPPLTSFYRLLPFVGVLIVGIGDSLASLVGRCFGSCKWPRTKKTVEGTASAVVGVLLCSAVLLWWMGVMERTCMGNYKCVFVGSIHVTDRQSRSSDSSTKLQQLTRIGDVVAQSGGAPIPEFYRLEDNPFLLQTNNLQIRMQSQPKPSPNFLLVPVNPNNGRVMEEYWLLFEILTTTIKELGLTFPWDVLYDWTFEKEETEELEQWKLAAFAVPTSPVYINHTITKTNVTFNFLDREISYPSDVFKYSLHSLNFTVPPEQRGKTLLERFRLSLSHPAINGTASYRQLENFQEYFEIDTGFFKATYTSLNFSVNNGEISPVRHLFPWEPILNSQNDTIGFFMTAEVMLAEDIEYDPSISVIVNDGYEDPNAKEEEENDDDKTTRILIYVFVPLAVVLVVVVIVVTTVVLRIRAKRDQLGRGTNSLLKEEIKRLLLIIQTFIMTL